MNDIIKKECEELANLVGLDIEEYDLNYDQDKKIFIYNIFSSCAISFPYTQKIISNVSKLFLEEFRTYFNETNVFFDYKFCFSEDFIRTLSSYNYLSEDDWKDISCHQKLSESFIREFQDKVFWRYISESQILSESFMREFQNKLYWKYVSSKQKLSEDFIIEFNNRLCWEDIVIWQTLTEKTIDRFYSFMNLYDICKNQVLSQEYMDKFVEKHINTINFDCLAQFQNLSEEFVIKYIDKLDLNVVFRFKSFPIEFIKNAYSKQKIYSEYIANMIKKELFHSLNLKESLHKEITREEKTKWMKEYAGIYHLKFDGEYLYAYRDHDKWGRGAYKKTIFYEKGNYYRDWHCDMNRYNNCSFGLGIWPKGNTKVKVSVDDWGCWVCGDDGKCRVWGFTVL